MRAIITGTLCGLFVGSATCACSLAIVLRGYHLLILPDWTEMQALRAMWAGWLAVVALAGVAAWLLKGKAER